MNSGRLGKAWLSDPEHVPQRYVYLTEAAKRLNGEGNYVIDCYLRKHMLHQSCHVVVIPPTESSPLNRKILEVERDRQFHDIMFYRDSISGKFRGAVQNVTETW